jgi:hypothetical protein
MKSAGRVPAVIQLTARNDHLGYASLASELLRQLTPIQLISSKLLTRTGLMTDLGQFCPRPERT